ncbi:putative intracellular protease/amidase [Streptosporangium becharense]|uniref:Putative intracellular protease/amidase n=1 Tax=Streptosporangium becharense TaxID=1816182 RepID=A0A7W9MJR8_9ACTN|nr:DJ-1/PfpI family protein [Streptosporangium becharense]MBB2914426.1 putative intracellular protease/amidase [Streptosporangium becharense]MBB5823542.1 putative intracellular protease/amidase [Streptosporangium becharense]
MPSPSPSPRRARTLALTVLGAVLGAVTVAGVGTAGVAVVMGDGYRAAPEAPPGGWPAPAPIPPGRTVVAVLAGATGSVAADLLAPYEVFARSPAFSVYTVAARRAPVPLSGGLHLLPDHTLAEVDAGTVPPPDVVVVPAVVEPAGGAEAPSREWITRQAARGAHVLGVCAGTELLAESGVLDGRRATSFWARIDALRRSRPEVGWDAGRRYVQDGPITTTAGVTSGIVGALRLVEQLAGTGEVERIGREVAYPDWSPSAPTRIPENRLALADLPYALNAAFPWGRPSVAVGLADGVGEIDVAAAFEVYSGTSFAARTIPVAAGRVVRTRHGAVLVAEPAGPDVTAVGRLVVPGVSHATGVSRELAGWAAGRGLRAELPHGGRGAGESGFDAVLRDLAAHADRATARATAKFIEYPASHLRLTGTAWPWRSTALCVATVAAALCAGLAPALVARRRRRAAGQG